MKKVLVTGAAGFIGSNLCAELLNKGYSVTGVDNLSHGSLENISSVMNNAAFTFHQEDISNKEFLETTSRDCDVIVHLAALKIPRYGGVLDTLTVNADGTRNVFEAAIKNDLSVYIASTSDVYGKNDKLPFNEESNLVVGPPTIGRWSYAVSKMFDEQLFFAYKEKYNIRGAVFRFFGSYGPNQNLSWWGGPQSVFIASSLKQKSMDIHGDGQQTRSFCYISDTVNGIIKTIETPQSDNHVFNIGNDQEITILDLAKKIWQLCGNETPAPLNIIPYESFKVKYEDVRRRIPDLSKAKRILGYEPMVDLDEGLKKTITWQKSKTL